MTNVGELAEQIACAFDARNENRVADLSGKARGDDVLCAALVTAFATKAAEHVLAGFEAQIRRFYNGAFRFSSTPGNIFTCVFAAKAAELHRTGEPERSLLLFTAICPYVEYYLSRDQITAIFEQAGTPIRHMRRKHGFYETIQKEGLANMPVSLTRAIA